MTKPTRELIGIIEALVLAIRVEKTDIIDLDAIEARIKELE